MLLAPTVNLHRTPIGGRNFECFSEDPVLTAELAVAYIDGLQAEGVAACVKHLVGNDTEFERMTISSEIDERTLRELYLVPFEAAVRRAGARAVMSGVQPAQRDVLRRAPLAAHRGAARRVGVRRRRDERLVRDAQRGRSRCSPGSTSRCRARPGSADRTSTPCSPPGRSRRPTSTVGRPAARPRRVDRRR